MDGWIHQLMLVHTYLHLLFDRWAAQGSNEWDIAPTFSAKEGKFTSKASGITFNTYDIEVAAAVRRT